MNGNIIKRLDERLANYLVESSKCNRHNNYVGGLLKVGLKTRIRSNRYPLKPL